MGPKVPSSSSKGHVLRKRSAQNVKKTHKREVSFENNNPEEAQCKDDIGIDSSQSTSSLTKSQEQVIDNKDHQNKNESDSESDDNNKSDSSETQEVDTPFKISEEQLIKVLEKPSVNNNLFLFFFLFATVATILYFVLEPVLGHKKF